MSLKNSIGVYEGLTRSWCFILVTAAFIAAGCGVSEEATTEQAPASAQKSGAVEQEKPKEEAKPMDQALTNFVGEDTDKPAEPAAAPAPAATAPSQLGQYEKQIEDLRTENTGLKQKLAMMEQENRGVNTRLAELEANYNAEKLRADKAEEASKSAPAAKTEEVAPVSMSTYDDALSAFNAKKYDSAEKGFKAIADGGGADELTTRAKYWLGETNFAKKKYKNAIAYFQEVLKMRRNDKKADAQFMVAQCYDRLGSKAKAKEAYEKVVKEYPMSKNVKRAKARWAKL